MEQFLRKEHRDGEELLAAFQLALDAWTLGHSSVSETGEIPAREQLRELRKQRLEDGVIEAALLDRGINSAVRYRALTTTDLAKLTAS